MNDPHLGFGEKKIHITWHLADDERSTGPLARELPA